MAIAVIMPRQGQSVETCIITQWYRKKGDPVKTGDILFSYETDKAAFEGEATADGFLLETFAQAGDEVAVLSNIAIIGNLGEDISEFLPGLIPRLSTAPASPEITHYKSTISPDTPSGSPRRISPRARIMAAKMGIEVDSIRGSGPNGRIIVKDLESPESRSLMKGDNTDFEERKISNVRKIIARAMHESISTSAQLTHHMSADVRKLLSFRNEIKSGAGKGAVNITLNDMICFAVIRALVKFPEVNSHFAGDSLKIFRKVHLGFAVDTPRGLMVPAVRNADVLTLEQLSVALKGIAEQCRKGNIDPELLSPASASFTVSNLGNYGVEMFTPIINLPQIAILGVNTIIHRPADLGDGAFGFIPVMGLSLTYDHRAIDGGPATLFLREIKQEIENFKP